MLPRAVLRLQTLFCHLCIIRNPTAVGAGGGRTYLLAPVRNGSHDEQFRLVICI